MQCDSMPHVWLYYATWLASSLYIYRATWLQSNMTCLHYANALSAQITPSIKGHRGCGLYIAFKGFSETSNAL